MRHYLLRAAMVFLLPILFLGCSFDSDMRKGVKKFPLQAMAKGIQFQSKDTFSDLVNSKLFSKVTYKDVENEFESRTIVQATLNLDRVNLQEKLKSPHIKNIDAIFVFRKTKTALSDNTTLLSLILVAVLKNDREVGFVNEQYDNSLDYFHRDNYRHTGIDFNIDRILQAYKENSTYSILLQK
jgi:hypothetical protein